MRQVFVIEARDNGLNPRHGPFATFTEAAALLDQLEARGIHAWTETTETSVSSTPSTAVGRAPFADFIRRSEPFNTPNECDHQGGPEVRCSHCCSCTDCAEIRGNDV